MITAHMMQPIGLLQDDWQSLLKACIPDNGDGVWIANGSSKRLYCLEILNASIRYVERCPHSKMTVSWPADSDRYGLFCKKIREVLSDVVLKKATV